jgi:hypothetical protein
VASACAVEITARVLDDVTIPFCSLQLPCDIINDKFKLYYF